MRIVNGCLGPTPVKYFPVFWGIAPPALRKELHHTSMLVKKALLDTSYLLHARIATAQNHGRQRLRSRRPFSRQAASLANSNFNLMEQWKHDWQEKIKPVQLTTPWYKHPTRSWSPTQRVGHLEPPPQWSRSFRRQHAPLGPPPLSSLSVWRSWADGGPYPFRVHQARTTLGSPTDLPTRARKPWIGCGSSVK